MLQGIESLISKEGPRLTSMPEERNLPICSQVRTKCMRPSSSLIWKHLSKSESRWPKDLHRLMNRERLRKQPWFKELLTASSKWRLMTSEEKRLTSWLLALSWREKSNWWIRDKRWKRILSRSKFTPNCGCLTMKRKLQEKKEKPKKKEKKFKKL